MKNRATAIKLSLGALALGTGLAAQAAAPVITNITMVGATPRFGVHSDLGTTNQIQCCTNLSQTNWVVLTNLVVTQSPYWFEHLAAPPASQRFYRVAALASTPPPNMALIPAGSFVMGATTNMGHEYYYEEVPQHTVYVSAFYMDRYEVSKALWDEVYEWATNRPANVRYSFEYGAQGKAANHPAREMTWYDCVKWCNARSEKEGRVPAYYTNAAQTVVYRSGTNDLASAWVNWSAGYRLPTEAEWEKAARGGASGHRFPWSDSDTIDWSRANYWVYRSASTNYYAYDVNATSGYNSAWTSGGTPYTTPVGTFAPNGYGLYDMAGNVWEWCWDCYGSYSSGSQTDPRGPSGSNRVFRGGAWNDKASWCRAASRYHYYPGFGIQNIGFRSVLPLG